MKPKTPKKPNPVGRPPAPPEKRKDARVQVAMTVADRAAVKLAAAAAGTTASQFILDATRAALCQNPWQRRRGNENHENPVG